MNTDWLPCESRQVNYTINQSKCTRNNHRGEIAYTEMFEAQKNKMCTF